MVAAFVRLARASEAEVEAAEEDVAGGIERATPGMTVYEHGGHFDAVVAERNRRFT